MTGQRVVGYQKQRAMPLVQFSAGKQRFAQPAHKARQSTSSANDIHGRRMEESLKGHRLQPRWWKRWLPKNNKIWLLFFVGGW